MVMIVGAFHELFINIVHILNEINKCGMLFDILSSVSTLWGVLIFMPNQDTWTHRESRACRLETMYMKLHEVTSAIITVTLRARK
jgi:hypothetical protein